MMTTSPSYSAPESGLPNGGFAVRDLFRIASRSTRRPTHAAPRDSQCRGRGSNPQAAFAAADFKSPPTVFTCRTPRIYRRLERTNRTKRTLFVAVKDQMRTSALRHGASFVRHGLEKEAQVAHARRRTGRRGVVRRRPAQHAVRAVHDSVRVGAVHLVERDVARQRAACIAAPTATRSRAPDREPRKASASWLRHHDVVELRRGAAGPDRDRTA